MDANPPSQAGSGPGKSFSLALKAFFRGLIRLVVLVLLVLLIAAGVYWGVPAYYRRIVQPVQDNAASISDLDSRLTQAESKIDEQLGALRDRIETLEIANDSNQVALADLQTQLEETQATLTGIDELSSRIADLQSQTDALQAELSTANEDLLALASQQSATDQTLAALSSSFEDAESPINALRRELVLVKVMELISRSRFSLLQGNAGLAREDLVSARNLVAGVRLGSPDFQQGLLQQVSSRLDLAIESLPELPDLAITDMDAAWELLVRGMPGEPGLIPSGTEGGEVIPSEGTPAPEVSATPAPTGTASP